jgi:hypothetical protein
MMFIQSYRAMVARVDLWRPAAQLIWINGRCRAARHEGDAIDLEKAHGSSM